MYEYLEEFQKKYPTKAEKEKALREMDNSEIDRLIEASGTVQGKIFYASFKKPEAPAGKQQ